MFINFKINDAIRYQDQINTCFVLHLDPMLHKTFRKKNPTIIEINQFFCSLLENKLFTSVI